MSKGLKCLAIGVIAAVFCSLSVTPVLAKSCWHSNDKNVRLTTDVWFNWEYAEEGNAFRITMKLDVKHPSSPIEDLKLHAILPYEPYFYPIDSANVITKVRGNLWTSMNIQIEPVVVETFEMEYATCSAGCFESTSETFIAAHYVFDLGFLGPLQPREGKGVVYDLILAGSYSGAYPVSFYATYTIDGVSYCTL
jgi:hypothetical protein